jgi:DNA-binding transcriptional ArsR family regulator
MKNKSSETKTLTNKLRAFSSISRLKILMCLGEGPKNVSQLLGNCGISQSAVSQHLTRLKDIGLLSCKSKGRERYYSLTDKKSAEISKYLIDMLNPVKKNHKSIK